MTPQPTGRHVRRDTLDAVAFDRTFRAPIEDVWAAVTESERLARWFGPWAGDPASGRVSVQMTAEGEGPAEIFHIEACEPPRHLRVRSDVPDPAQAWTLDLELTEAGDVTLLRFAQLIDDPALVPDVGPGWQFYLDRLDVAFAGGDADSMSWDDYPQHGPHYAREFGLPS